MAVAVLGLASAGCGGSGAHAGRGTGAAVSSALDVQPFPGTPDASPQTDVGFPALAPRQIKSLRVSGSRTGEHAGRIVKLPGGGGAAFVPARPFGAGERVRVRAILRSGSAGTASGAPGATRLSFAFTVAVNAPLRPRARRPDAPSASPTSPSASPTSSGLTHSFHSEPELHPPTVEIRGRDPDPDQGDIATNPENLRQHGPLILTPQGRLIYFKLTRSLVFDVQVQRYHGQTVLTYWGPHGCDVILNHRYRQIARVCAAHGYSADAHEFQITPEGNALISVYAPVKADLSSIGGPRHGRLIDSLIQEINIPTGQLIWEWHASGHVPLDSTYTSNPRARSFDFFHINSIQQLPGDKLLVSGRNTWAVYEIDMRTGRVMLEIGGRHSDFRIGPGANFEWQHDARMHPDGTMTVFDNATVGGVAREPESRALRIRLNFERRRATLVHAFANRPPVLASSQGSVQPLRDGYTFVGWGAAPYLAEFNSRGAQLFTLHFGPGVRSYHGLRVKWWGQPTTPPSVAVIPTSRGTRVYASWNGATTVKSWQVLVGTSAAALIPVGQFAKTSFETKMWVPSTAAYFAVRALSSRGQPLGTSATVPR